MLLEHVKTILEILHRPESYEGKRARLYSIIIVFAIFIYSCLLIMGIFLFGAVR